MAEVPDNDRVDKPISAYEAMAERWRLINDLLDGTPAMRNARTLWLPMEPKEQPSAYETRLGRAVLFNGFKHAVTRLAEEPFTKPISLKGAEELDERLAEIEYNTDLADSDLTQFSRAVFEDAVAYGKSHILVDFPRVPRQATLADERRIGARPYFVHVTARQVIGWRTERLLNGREELSMLRYVERVSEPDGEFGEREVSLVRVWTKEKWQVWREKQDKSRYELVDEGPNTLGKIPLVTFYTKKTGFLTAKPPLEELAWINLAHWQSFSDQRNILRFARVGILFAAGMSVEDIENQNFSIGPNNLLTSTNPEASLKYVEHQGSAIEAGFKDLETLEKRMEVLGLQPFVERTASSTATGKRIDEKRTQTLLESWITEYESVIYTAFELAADWIKTSLPESFGVDVNNDFLLDLSNDPELRELGAARARGDIDRRTYLEEIKRRGVISPHVDIDKVIAQVEQEGPSLETLIPTEDDPDASTSGE